ncbi:MAG: sigma 54-interacting transcriptional regulator, partial [Planctomycetota bacterium]
HLLFFPLLQVVKHLFLLCSDLFTALGGSSYSTYFTALNGKHFGQHNTASLAAIGVLLTEEPAQAAEEAGEDRQARMAATPEEQRPVDLTECERLLEIKNRSDPNRHYIGESVAILKVFEQIDIFNRSPDKPVLILGSEGTGKTHIAELIHQHSGRSGQFKREQAVFQKGPDPRIPIGRLVGFGKGHALPNIPGHGTTGVLHECIDGTYFLDELANLPLEFQEFLLDFSEGQEIPKPAGTGTSKLNVRLICATNRNPEELVDQGSLRKDLLDRIGMRRIEIPALADQLEDIFHFVRDLCTGKGYEPTSQFHLALLQYGWPGNVRELIHVLDLAMDQCTGSGRRLTPDLLTLAKAPQIVQQVIKMNKEDAEREVYRSLATMLMNQGLRRGMGLQKRMVDFLCGSPATVSRKAKKYLTDLK